MTPTDTLREAVARAVDNAIDDHGEFATGAMATAALSAIESAGWRVVPAEPNEPTVVIAAMETGIKPSVLRASYRAMLGAAPRLDATVRSGEEG